MPDIEVVLASRSPRRRELLAQLGVRHRVVAVDIDEIQRDGEAPHDFAQRMAAQKARAAWREDESDTVIVAADTIVVVDGEVLGKPRDSDHADAMLKKLSAREHAVLSAVTVRRHRASRDVISETRVWFRALEPAEREAYLATGEAFDKAGAYAIQGRAAIFVARLDGSYSGVMGLPLFETASLLREAGYNVLRPPRAV